MTKSILVLIGLCLLAACVPAYKIDISASADQSVKFVDGRKIVISEMQESTVVLVPPLGPVEKRGEFGVIAFNNGTTELNFGTENISASAADGTSVHVFSYVELLEEEKSRQTWAAVAAGLAAAGNSMQAANAGHSTSHGSYSGTTYGSYGSTPYSANTYGTGYVTTYDPAKAQAAQAIANQENQAMLQNMKQANARNEARLQSILKKTTILPGYSHSGQTQFEVPTTRATLAEPIEFHVVMGRDHHIFKLEIERAK